MWQGDVYKYFIREVGHVYMIEEALGSWGYNLR